MALWTTKPGLWTTAEQRRNASRVGPVADQMSRGVFAAPVRRGDTVERRAGPGSRSVRALLEHFERVGFDLAPRFLGTTAGGTREVLTFIEGETGYPPLAPAFRTDEALVSVASAIRAMHDATRGFPAGEHDGWAAPEVAAPVAVDCVGHRDLAPWNLVFDGSSVVGVIDWDFAGPSNRVWDLAYAAHQFVPFHPTPHLPAYGWAVEPDRAARLRSFAEAYGMGVTPDEIVDLAIVRLTATAAHMEARIRARDPAYELHRRDGHAEGYRAAATFVAAHRTAWLR